MSRFLTKSLFKLGRQCPTKLYYERNKSAYANQRVDDPFLEALAEGGFQVGALAKIYYPNGIEIDERDSVAAVVRTQQLLSENDEIVLFEAAVQSGPYLVRVDILEKKGASLVIHEVKAKSFDPHIDTLTTKAGAPRSIWREFLEDIAFQKFVLHLAYPNAQISAHLGLIDKTATSPVDRLNALFRVSRDSSGRAVVEPTKEIPEELQLSSLLLSLNVDQEIDYIFQETVDGQNFSKSCEALAAAYIKDSKLDSPIASKCGKCEFRKGESSGDLKSGYEECFVKQLGWQNADFRDPTVFDIGGFQKKQKLLDEGKIKLLDLTSDDIGVKASKMGKLTQSERQWLQVKKVQDSDDSIYVDRDGLKLEFASLNYPLHFIDFETSTLALPFSKGRRPYETVAFQFSHHLMHESGLVEHKTEHLEEHQSFNSNYKFVRALREALGNDEGSIFRYSNHENAVLNQILHQLVEDPNEIQDREELISFIRSISSSSKDSTFQWEGQRNMKDLLDWVKWYYFDPATGGSNSIKQVLPTILNASTYLKFRYGSPVYGTKGGIPSHNFESQTWIVLDEEGRVKDPYKLLPPVFPDSDKSNPITVANGGAALTAYSRMQFTNMPEPEREALRKSLLRYCELDTLAMLMLFEGLKEMTGP